VTEVTASFLVFRNVFIGAGFRTNKRVNMSGTDNMLIGILELDITHYLRLGYSYDYYLNRGGRYNSGTHEVMLGWDIGKDKSKTKDPRYF
jgi:hypothetical protein